MVDAVGVEPTMPLRRRIYSPLGLPIFLHIQVDIITLSIDYVNLSSLSSGVGKCVVKHSPDYVRRRFVAGRESALLRWVFSHTTQGASHPPGRPHYSIV